MQGVLASKAPGARADTIAPVSVVRRCNARGRGGTRGAAADYRERQGHKATGTTGEGRDIRGWPAYCLRRGRGTVTKVTLAIEPSPCRRRTNHAEPGENTMRTRMTLTAAVPLAAALLCGEILLSRVVWPWWQHRQQCQREIDQLTA